MIGSAEMEKGRKRMTKCERLDANFIKISDEFVFNINLNSGWYIREVEFDKNTKPVEEFKVTFIKRKVFKND